MIYQVGGSVRDKFLGRESDDIDYACEFKSYDEMKEYILSKGGKIYQEKPQFLAILASINGQKADFVLCRKEGAYRDGRRPDEVEIGTIYDDLARRDFTMNAIAIAQDGTIIDPYGGQEDIKGLTIKCVGKARERFTEDSLRLLRAVRFKIVLGMYMDSEIERCLEDDDLISLLVNVSAERVMEELTKCFKHDAAEAIIQLGGWRQLTDFLLSDKLKQGRVVLKPSMEYRK